MKGEDADSDLKEGGFIILVTTTPNIYKLVLDDAKVTVKVKLLAIHERVIAPVKSVQTESIENYKMLGKFTIKILLAFSNAF
jgi:hypothetical protein